MRQKLFVVASIVTAAALVAACGGAGAEAPTSPEPPAGSTLTLAFSHIDVIQDCDGIEGNGDFTFSVQTYQMHQADRQIYEASPNLGPGARHTVARTTAYVIPAGDGDTFVSVRFRGTEWDKSIVGVTYPDARLAGFDVRQHKYTNGTWSNLGVHDIVLGTETPNDCMVRLTYTASASKS